MYPQVHCLRKWTLSTIVDTVYEWTHCEDSPHLYPQVHPRARRRRPTRGTPSARARAIRVVIIPPANFGHGRNDLSPHCSGCCCVVEVVVYLPVWCFSSNTACEALQTKRGLSTLAGVGVVVESVLSRAFRQGSEALNWGVLVGRCKLFLNGVCGVCSGYCR